ncbi:MULTISPECIES: DUF3299 domain-containing protein [Chitinibacter]|uniref:DUF3299 domain-containing protein n=1 Tax=Chitinibacter TaxID=230666 RepID=UPI0006886131|nr:MULTISPECIES: DUF3299 domain-containing protein [Chitinibacter]
MPSLFRLACGLVFALCCQLSLADSKPVKWADLQPDAPALRASIAKMDQAQKMRLMRAVQQREVKSMLDKGKLKAADLTANDIKLLKEDFADLNKLIAEIEQFEKKRTGEMITTLNNQDIQIDGYLLPLKLSGKKITEFLLVPVIGACIHVPAPPPNQMIVVQYPKGFEQTELYAPVTVAGKLQIKAAKANLALADGAADVPVGYQLAAAEVRPYVKPAAASK